MVTKNDLTVPDLMVMEALTHSITTPSAVSLAADLWQPDSSQMGADPVGFVVWVLENLASLELVTYRMKVTRHNPANLDDELQGRDPYEKLPFQIRLSRSGWELMGYTTFHLLVNSRLSTMQRLDPKGDRTNFRKHDFKAEGGVVEKDTFAEHQVLFPTHTHMYYDEDEMASTQRRQYVRITEAIEAQITKYRDEHPEATATEISDALMFSDRTVRYVLYDLPRIRRNAHEEGSDKSQKQRIMLALRTQDYENITDLRRTLGRADTSHDIVHALHDLHSEGRVDFTENGSRKEPIRIRITDRGRAYVEKMEFDQAAADAATVVEAPVQQTLQSLVEEVFAEAGRDKPEWPELDNLLEREKKRLDGDNRAMRYIEAAELIRENDPETAKLLDDKASESDVPFPSPVEAEYMRYVAAHPEAGDASER